MRVSIAFDGEDKPFHECEWDEFCEVNSIDNIERARLLRTMASKGMMLFGGGAAPTMLIKAVDD